jgi:glycosyltransferase involved in cell wall biosynthesis
MSERRAYDVAFYMPWIGPLLAPGATPATGGAETQIAIVARALAERGLRVCIVAFQVPEGLPERFGGADVIARPPYGGGRGPLGRLREALAMFGVLRRIDAGVVVTRAAGPNVGIVGLFAWLWRRRFVYSSANVVDFTFELEKVRLHRFLYKLGVRLARTIVVQSEEQVRLCREAFGREPVLIGSVAEPVPPAERRPDAFVWAGRLVWYKHPLKLAELARRVPEARFRLVGVPVPPEDDELVAALEHEAAELPNLELSGPLPRAELLELMDAAVGVVNTADFEGMPNIFLEGWARGVPALALSHDPDGVVARHGVGCYAGGSMDRLAGCARELWARRDDMDDLRERCVRYAEEHHSEDAVAARWLSVVTGGDPARSAERVRGELTCAG